MSVNKRVETDSPELFIEEMEKIQGALPKRIDANPRNVEKGLAKLVLTLIELIRKLLEKQAMRRIDAGSLTEEEIERVGETLMKLENKMQELKGVFGLKDEELNINLGPFGDLM
ncbi:MAG: gas vesicle protein K [Candidatus Omnitrophica bacterium]|nr:gas vesicle protein K [Candidatus Omnitrophota bacterium]